MSKIDLLKEQIYYRNENKLFLLERIKKEYNEDNVYSFVGVWSSDVIYLAIQELVIVHNVEKAKQHFYTSARLQELLIKKRDDSSLDWNIKVLCYAVLSDCKSVIETYGSLRHTKYEALMKNGSSTFIYIFQAIIREDWNDFEYLMGIMKEKSIKKYKVLEIDYLFFQSIFNKDKLGCETSINQLLEKRNNNYRNKYNFHKDFFSFPALGYAKLAWLKGIEVEINHPLVPKELLIVNPISKYVDEFDFLEEDNKTNL